MKLHLTYEFDSEDEMRAHLDGTSERSETTPAATVPDTPPADDGEPTRDSLDKDGMPYDPEIHSDPPKFTAAGIWRARQGKADEAKQAREAFKAGGGDVQPPEGAGPLTMPTGMPGLSNERAELPADAPEPVSMETLIGRIKEVLTDGKITSADIEKLYEEHSGRSVQECFPVFQTNETARASLMSALNNL